MAPALTTVTVTARDIVLVCVRFVLALTQSGSEEFVASAGACRTFGLLPVSEECSPAPVALFPLALLSLSGGSGPNDNHAFHRRIRIVMWMSKNTTISEANV